MGDWLAAGAIGFAFSIEPAGGYFLWRIDASYGAGYCVATYVALFVLYASDFGARWAKSPAVMLPAVGALILLAVTVVPVAILPAVRPSTVVPKESPPIDVAFFKHSADQIQHSMSRAITDIQSEQSRLGLATQRLLSVVAEQNAAIAHLQNERARLIKQVEYQSALASLTKAQADAVMQALTRGKYVDYFLGFIIGVASSLTATFGSRLFRKRRPHTAEIA
jgi:hypothetical protein